MKSWLAAFLLLLPSLASAECPASATLCGTGDFITGEPAASTTAPAFEKHCDFAGINGEDATFDIPAGKFEVDVSEGGEMTLWLRDLFTLNGPAPGTPVSLHLRVSLEGSLNYTGSCCPDSQAHVDLTPIDPHPGDPSADWSFGRTGVRQGYVFADSLDLVLPRTAGEPVGIEIHALSRLHYSDSVRIRGTFRFVDLQPGWTVTSCKGYVLDQPVAASPTSWGRVKSRYR